MATPTNGTGHGSVFLSYRREDARHLAGRLYDRLTDRFGPAHVFMDVDSIEPGTDFTAAIENALASCEVLLALIGPNWLDARDELGQRRLDDPDDFIVVEISAALRRDVRVLPVLVDGAPPPRTGQLPEALMPLAHRNAMRVDHETFRTDVDALLDAVKKILASAETAPSMSDPPSTRPPVQRPSRTSGPIPTSIERFSARIGAHRPKLFVGIAILVVIAVAAVVALQIPRRSVGGIDPTQAVAQFDVSSIPVRGRVDDLAIDSDNHTLYTGNLDGDTQVFDTNTLELTGTIPIDGVQGLALDARSKILYGSDFNNRKISVIDIPKRAAVGTLTVPDGPTRFSFNAGAGLLYVPQINSSNVLVFDVGTRAQVASVATDESMVNVGVATDDSGGLSLEFAFVATAKIGHGAGAIFYVDGERKVVDRVSLDQEPLQILFNRANADDTGVLYVATKDNSVLLIDVASRAITARISVGKNPASLAIDPASRTLYAANYDDNTVTAIDMVSKNVLSTIHVGSHPSSLAVNTNTHVVYCANVEDTSVSIIKRRT